MMRMIITDSYSSIQHFPMGLGLVNGLIGVNGVGKSNTMEAIGPSAWWLMSTSIIKPSITGC